MSGQLSVVSFGGGLNSTALLVGLHERGEHPSAILFADTGGEHPETYPFVERVGGWLRAIRFPPLTRVSNVRDELPHKSLEDECHNNQTLPSLAFGYKGCSAKWKRQPMDRYLAAQDWIRDEWAAGRKVERLIGIDAGESHRSQSLVDTPNPKWVYRRPLVEWGWGRDECEVAVRRAGLPRPRKSACFYCPGTTKGEILCLSKQNPDLFARAVEMERIARDAGNLHVVKGLGRNWSWEQLVRADRAQLRLFPEAPEIACGCMDEEGAA